MKVSKLALLVLMAVLQQSLAQNFVQKMMASVETGAHAVNHAVGKEMSDVANPIAQGISLTAGSQCNALKKVLKLDYNHTDPDLDDIILVFTTPDIKVTFPLRAAATELTRTVGSNAKYIFLNIFAHGFTDNPSKKNFQMVNDAYQSVGMNATLGLDASDLISYCYLCSSTYVQHIGRRLGKALADLYDIGLVPDNVHLVGHSLGAHICGFTGKEFTNTTGQKVGRVTGLDPAGPCFGDIPEDFRLKATDAKFVDVIHTNTGVLGIKSSVGHVDFYPNGGSQQTNCVLETCNHSFAVKLFAFSILNRNAFPARQCADYDAFSEGNCTDVINYMGEAADPSLQGQFYLQTNGEDPLGKGPDGMTYVNTNGVIRRVGEAIVGVFDSS